jgi:hypothetical protein
MARDFNSPLPSRFIVTLMIATSFEKGAWLVLLKNGQPDTVQPQNGQADPAHGMTVGQVAKYLRLGEDRIRAMIRSGELAAIDTSYPSAAKRRYVVLPEDLRKWIERRRAAEPKRAPRRRPAATRAGKKDRFPDD